MANAYTRDSAISGWRPVGLIVPTTPVPGDPPPPPPPDRPALTAAPGPSTTGPRVAITGETLSGSAAISLAQANGGTLVGRRITNLTFDQPSHGSLIFQDCEIGPGGTYVVNGWFSSYPRPTGGQRVILDHCRINGGTKSAAVIGFNFILLHCDVRLGIDNSKPYGSCEIYASWMHDTYHPDGGHCDTIQVRSGNDFLIHWNRLDGFNDASSVTQAGGRNNGCLQTGSVSNNLTNFHMNDNWVNGGFYTVRGPDNDEGHTVSMTWRRNKHGRDFSFGPIVRMNEPGADYDSSNVWQDDGTPVLGA